MAMFTIRCVCLRTLPPSVIVLFELDSVTFSGGDGIVQIRSPSSSTHSKQMRYWYAVPGVRPTTMPVSFVCDTKNGCSGPRLMPSSTNALDVNSDACGPGMISSAATASDCPGSLLSVNDLRPTVEKNVSTGFPVGAVTPELNDSARYGSTTCSPAVVV